MHVHHLYCDAHGQSHFRDIEVELTEPSHGGFLSKPQSVSAMMFRQIEPGVSRDWHNAPSRQYVISLCGRLKTIASDGESRTLGAGEVMLVEDTIGKGHKVEALPGAPFRAIFVEVK